MVTIELSVSGLLFDSAGGSRVVPLQARTLADAVDAIAAQYPSLCPHVFDDHGRLRNQVGLFFNGENLRWIVDQDIALKAGDRLEILQAASGG